MNWWAHLSFSQAGAIMCGLLVLAIAVYLRLEALHARRWRLERPPLSCTKRNSTQAVP